MWILLRHIRTRNHARVDRPARAGLGQLQRLAQGRGLLISVFLEEPLERPTCALRLQFIVVLIYIFLEEPLEQPAGAEKLPALLTCLFPLQLSACLRE